MLYLQVSEIDRREENECSEMSVEGIAMNEERELKHFDCSFWSATDALIYSLSFDKLCPLIFHSSKGG